MVGLFVAETKLVPPPDVPGQLQGGMCHDPEPHGQAALLLCESLMMPLVENGLLAKERAVEAVEAVDHVLAVKREGVVVSMVSIGLLRSVESSLAAATVLDPRPRRD